MDEQGRAVLRRFLAGLILVVLLFILIWFIFLRDPGKKEAGNNNGRNATTQTDEESAPPKSAQTQTGSTTSNHSNTSGQVQAAERQNSTGTQQLAATGPEHTVTLFMTSAAVATFGHYLYTTRRKQIRS